MRNPLQEQLLKAGLVKKSKVAQVAHEQAKARHAKGPAVAPAADAVDVERLRLERVERDRALAAERNAQAKAGELRAQARQIIETQAVRHTGELEYRFTDGSTIRTILVDALARTQLASGALTLARQAQGNGVVLLPRAAADKVLERDASLIVVDHGRPAVGAPAADATAVSDDDAYYAQFKVPDDLAW